MVQAGFVKNVVSELQNLFKEVKLFKDHSNEEKKAFMTKLDRAIHQATEVTIAPKKIVLNKDMDRRSVKTDGPLLFKAANL